MKILIVSQYYYPEQFQINDIAPALAKKGHQVTILCGLPNYPKGKVFPGYKAKRGWQEVIDGVKIIRCWQIPRGDNPVMLMLNYVSFVISGKKAIKKLPKDFDIVLSYQLSPVSMILPAIKYKKMHKVPLLIYCLDIWPESALAHVKFAKGLLYRFISILSKKIYNQCDKILVASRPFINYLHEKNGVPFENMSYLPQHAGTDMLNMNFTTPENDCADFMFAGNMGAAQILETLVLAAAELGPRKDYKLHFVGDGSQRKLLEKLVREKMLEDNVLFHGYQRQIDMPSFYKRADVLMICLRGTNAVGETMPGKLQMYMTIGKPILGAINGAAREVINEARCGKCVASADFKGLAALMLDYIEHPNNYASCGENARKYFADNFTLDKYIQGIDTALLKLIK